MRLLFASVFAVAIALGVAQPVPALLEGKITAIDGLNNRIAILGFSVHVPATAVIRTPYRVITFAELLGNPLPSRSTPGFLNGTAIVDAEYVNGELEATAVTVIPEESSFAGPITTVAGGLRVMGKRVVLIGDSRIKGVAANRYGFPLSLAYATVGTDMMVDGYLGNDGAIYAWRITADMRLSPAYVGLVITSARARNGNRVQVDGALTANSGTVTLRDADTNAVLGTSAVIPGAFHGTYAFDVTVATMPTNVKVTHTNGSWAVLAVTP